MVVAMLFKIRRFSSLRRTTVVEKECKKVKTKRFDENEAELNLIGSNLFKTRGDRVEP